MKQVITILLLASFSLCAQKDFHAESTQNGDFLFLNSHKEQIRIQNFNDENIQNTILGLANFGESVILELNHKIESKAFTHYHFDILIDGKKVLANKIHASLDRAGLLRVNNIPTLPDNIFGQFPSESEAVFVQNQIGAKNILNTEAIYVATSNGGLQRALSIELEGPETLHRCVIFANGEIIYNQDLHKYHASAGPNDSIVSVRIFEPDPLSSAEQPYGLPYADGSDENNPQLQAETMVRNTIMVYDNGRYIAENDFVKIKDFSKPSMAPVSSVTKQMHYTRDTSYFEDVNVVYHITNHKQHLASLGFPNLPSYQIEVDPHALSGSDQSFFSTASLPYRLYFGEGGVDDAEDADVVLHEFTHAVIFEASPSGNISIERGCIEEALCDYFAASYSSSITSYNASKVFNWDAGDGQIWAGRSVQSEKYYGLLSFKNGNYYSNTDIIASCLMTIYGEIGRAKTDELVLEALFNLSGNTTMPDFAGFMLLADTALNNGIHSSVIINAFDERNIVANISLNELSQSVTHIQVYNTHGFAKGGNLIIESEENLQAYTIYNMNGQPVYSNTWEASKQAEISLPELTSGAYILSITTTSGQTQNIRVVRF